MPSRLLCLLLCFAVAACVTPAQPCHGPAQPINLPPQSKAAQASSLVDPHEWIP
jgi:hypothetical protein